MKNIHSLVCAVVIAFPMVATVAAQTTPDTEYEAVAEESKDKVPSKLHYFGNEDPGALVNISGAGALKSSGDPELAQEFLAYVVSKEGQTAITESGDWEYPLNSAVPPPPGLKPFDTLEPPKVSPADLGDGSGPVELMEQVGLL